MDSNKESFEEAVKFDKLSGFQLNSCLNCDWAGCATRGQLSTEEKRLATSRNDPRAKDPEWCLGVESAQLKSILSNPGNRGALPG